MNIKPTTVLVNLMITLVLLGVLAACGSPSALTEIEAPIFSEPKISAPTPQEPGKEIGISIDVTSASGVALDYDWSADGGEIVRGQDSPAITYRTPDEPGVYFVRVNIRWGNNSVEKMTSIQVEAPAAANPTVTPTPSPARPIRTPTPRQAQAEVIQQWDAEVAAEFVSITRKPDASSDLVVTLKKGDGFDIRARNQDQTWVFGQGQSRFGWLPVDKLQINISLDGLEVREVATSAPPPTSTLAATATPAPPAPTATEAPAAVQEEPAPAENYAGTVLRALLRSEGDNWAAHGQLIQNFTNQTGIEVEVVEAPNSVTDQLDQQQQYLSAGSSEIDIYQIDVIWPGILAEHAVDLYQHVPQEELSAHFPSILQNNTWNGKLVGLPWQTDAGLLYYRTDLLQKYGYGAPPQTWDELTEMANVIQAGERSAGNNNFWGFVWQGNAYEGLTCDALEWQASEGGGHIIEPDGRITINNPAAARAFQRAAGWVGTISPPNVISYQEEDARGVWNDGNAAFMRNWPYAYSLTFGSAVGNNFAVTTLPAGASGQSAATLGGWQLMVSRYSNNVEAAALFVRHMTSAESQKARAISLGLLPTIGPLYSDGDVIRAQPQVPNLLPVFNNSVARPSTVTGDDYGAVSAAYFNAVHAILTGQQDAGSALAGLEQQLVNITGFPTGAP